MHNLRGANWRLDSQKPQIRSGIFTDKPKPHQLRTIHQIIKRLRACNSRLIGYTRTHTALLYRGKKYFLPIHLTLPSVFGAMASDPSSILPPCLFWFLEIAQIKVG